jgi:hypothetical protein
VTRHIAVYAVAVAIALGGTSLSAHDMWIEPATFSPTAGEIVPIKLRVGQDFLGDPLPRDPALINQFFVIDGEGRKPVVGRDGSDPAGFIRVATPGLLIVGYRSNPSAVDLTAEKFNQYLKEEGLDAIAAVRARRGQTGGARDLFSRCAKTLVSSGTPREGQGDRPLGFTLELVAERNPVVMTASDDLPVRLTYENRPLPGTLVVAINRAHPGEKLSARTDKDGRAHFRLTRGGMWLIKAVHMIEAPVGAGADWVSYWASLTFDMPQRNSPRSAS